MLVFILTANSSYSQNQLLTIVADAVGYQLLIFRYHTDGMLTIFNVLQAHGLQEITNETFEETMKEVEGKFMSVVSGCFIIIDCIVNKLPFSN